jgi:RNA methyltransferase, TrmH family
MNEIKSLSNPLVKHLVKLRKDRQYRHESGTVVITGEKLVREAAKKVSLQKLFIEERRLPRYSDIPAEEVYAVTTPIAHKIDDVVTSEGVVAEVAIPPQHSLEGKKYVLIIDGVSDPGNMGTLLRTALALAWEGVFIVEGSVDPFNSKSIRASRGALLSLPYRIGPWEDIGAMIQEKNMAAYVADLKGEAPVRCDASGGVFLVMGNEAYGPSQQAKDVCAPISVPMRGDMESLNVAVAGGILLYELNKGE